MGGQLSKALGRSFNCLTQSHTLTDYLTTGRLFGNKEMRILMLGLDAAGKTSTQSFYISLCTVGNGHVFDVTY